MTQIPEYVLPNSTVTIEDIYSWTSQLASETRSSDWIDYWYIFPDEVKQIIQQLETMNGGVIALVGLQGAGKSSALLALEIYLNRLQHGEAAQIAKKRIVYTDPMDMRTVRFKWRREQILLKDLEGLDHELSNEFAYRHQKLLLELLKYYYPLARSDFFEDNPRRYSFAKGILSRLDFFDDCVESLDTGWAIRKLGSRISKDQPKHIWLEILRNKKTILIDTPDYARTDRRLLAKDLDELYWLWNHLTTHGGPAPNIVITIQKEMFRNQHFFLGKMKKIELPPLTPKQMLAAYLCRFNTAFPFTEDALLTLARMSRGIFRRYLQYITLTLQHWEARKEPYNSIDPEMVKTTITTEHLAEDMELELSELFPKQSELRLKAVQILLHLQESGPKRQTQLTKDLDLEPYKLSRLLEKLELHKYVKRKRDGIDKIVNLTETK